MDESGGSVAISTNGKLVIIGAWKNDGNGNDSGHARVYEEINGNWVQFGQDIDGETAEDHSGVNVSMAADGSTVAIGAFGNSENGFRSGHVRVYSLNASTNAEDIITPNNFTLSPNPTNGEFFIDLKENYKQVSLEITDVGGRFIQHHDYYNVAGIPIKIKREKGIYFVKVQTDSKANVFKVIIL